MTQGTSRGDAEGADYFDLCADTRACACCSLWQQAGESAETWKARLRDLFDPEGTRCMYGHELDGANLYVAPSTGERHCRTCRRRNEANRRQRQRATA